VAQVAPQPVASAVATVHATQPLAHAPVAPVAPVAEFPHQPPAVSAVAPTVNAAPAYSPQPLPLVQPAQQPVPLVQPAQQPVPLAASAVKDPQRRSKAPTVFPETAARPQTGINGLPRLDFYTDFLGDITNHGGVFVATWTAVAIGTSCEVELQFPGDLRADVQGVVRWRRQVTDVDSSTSPGLGVEITKANDEAWGLIKRFISKRDPIIQDV
jgi:Tfp pilus assembly protein PilZ